jgi:cob(I)alamin adenosyltransferase
VRAVDQEDVEALEAAIDAAETELEPLRHFVMPCGCEAAVRLHVARTTCRRAERVIVALGGEGVDPAVLRWVNRLSDLLFVQARWANHEAGVPDVPWAPKRT